ncbi:PREDICTED: FRIGIDA-like protein 1 [Tarenaya hassleriana]|uniref:FRIGIDA-like protein 1 n=1 Tax=Tarenaya hassleriana TaxID=28532 RepID=UPI00053C9DE6|nr:PREDICTED: FRIGIDA-like protein 1 [Tarenaya hassleriana]
MVRNGAPTMATVETIAAAINQIDSKKESLKKAFDDLQAYSSLLSPSFSLSWSDIDRHFSSRQTSLSDRLRLLESLQPPPDPTERVKSAAEGEAEGEAQGSVARPELRPLCDNMDGKRLVRYAMDHPDDQAAIKREFSSAIRCASDPAAMVLDTVEGFFAESSCSDKSADVRRFLVSLLSCLMEIDANLGFDVRDRAKRVASDWRRRIGLDVRKAAEMLAFLHFVAAYELSSEFHPDELVDYFFLISKYKEATFLCRKIGLGDKVADIIKEILDRGNVIHSIKFIVEFHVVQFNPVTILKSYLEKSGKASQKVLEKRRNSLKAQIEATDKEIGVLRAVIKVIKEHKLEAEFSLENLEERVKELEKEKASRKRNTNPPKPQQQPMQQQFNHRQQPQPQKPMKRQFNNMQQQQQGKRGKKRPRCGPPNRGPPNRYNSMVPPQPQPQPQPQLQLQPQFHNPEGVLPGHPGSYQVDPYSGLVSSNHGVIPYAAGSLPGVYSSVATSAGYPGNADPANPQLYPTEPNVNPVYYSEQTGYGGYPLPTQQYYPAYYPPQ